MNARGEKEQTRYISNTGFNYFSQLGDVSKARCFVLRAGTWLGGNPGPPLAGRSPLQLSSSRSASIIDLKGKRGGSHTQGSRRFWEERQTSSRKKVASAGCPAWRIFCEWKGTKCKAVCCYSDLEEKREREGEERGRKKRVSPSVQGWVVASCCCCFCFCSCSCRFCHQVRLLPPLFPLIGIASCVIASGYTHRNSYMINKVLPSVVRSWTRLHTDLASELGTGAWFCFGKLQLSSKQVSSLQSERLN